MLYTNLELSKIGLEKVSVLDHQVTLEVAARRGPLADVPLRHRADLGLHHTETGAHSRNGFPCSLIAAISGSAKILSKA